MKHVPRYTFALTLLAFMAAGALYLWYVTRVPEEAPIGALDIYEMRFDKPDILERLEVKNFTPINAVVLWVDEENNAPNLPREPTARRLDSTSLEESVQSAKSH